MPRLNLKLDQATTFEAIEEGEYLVRVLDISDPEQGPKAQYVNVQVEVTDGEYEGRRFFRNLPTEGKGAGFFMDFWKKATGEDLEKEPEIDVDTDDAIGAKLVAVIVKREYPEGSGEFRNEVKRFLTA